MPNLKRKRDKLKKRNVNLNQNGKVVFHDEFKILDMHYSFIFIYVYTMNVIFILTISYHIYNQNGFI